MNSGWHPISTAPRDGTRILYRDRFGRIGHCHWSFAINEDEQDCWWDTEQDDEAVPRFWMQALPEPPQETSDEA